MEKTVLTLYTAHDTDVDTAFGDKKYQAAYEYLYTLAKEHGLRMCRAPLSWYDAVADRFSKAWVYESGMWSIVSDIRPDMIYDKSATLPENHALRTLLASRYPFMNDPEFSRVAGDKFLAAELLPEHFKRSLLVESQEILPERMAILSGERLVAKPLHGSGGEGVVIADRTTLAEENFEYPIILQEFIDSSRGIANITPGYHDLRLVFVNDALIYSYIRIPREGSLLANVAQGGRMQIVEPQDLPQSLDPIVRDVQAALSKFPNKIYTIDLMFDETGRPWIVELNTMPGIYFSPGQEKERDAFFLALIKEFKRCLDRN